MANNQISIGNNRISLSPEYINLILSLYHNIYLLKANIRKETELAWTPNQSIQMLLVICASVFRFRFCFFFVFFIFIPTWTFIIETE